MQAEKRGIHSDPIFQPMESPKARVSLAQESRDLCAVAVLSIQFPQASPLDIRINKGSSGYYGERLVLGQKFDEFRKLLRNQNRGDLNAFRGLTFQIEQFSAGGGGMPDQASLVESMFDPQRTFDLTDLWNSGGGISVGLTTRKKGSWSAEMVMRLHRESAQATLERFSKDALRQ